MVSISRGVSLLDISSKMRSSGSMESALAISTMSCSASVRSSSRACGSMSTLSARKRLTALSSMLFLSRKPSREVIRCPV